MAPFSSRGPTWYDAFAKPDIVAPGDRLVSTGARGQHALHELPDAAGDGSRGGQYLRLSGTSMATAVTTGVVALAIEAAGRQRRPATGPRCRPTRSRPSSSTRRFPSTAPTALESDRLTEGGGGLNAAGAIQLADSVENDVPSAAPGSPRSPTPSTTIGGETLLWEQNIVWGVWQVPGSVLLTNSPCWGNNIVWGVADGQNIVWGVAARGRTSCGA